MASDLQDVRTSFDWQRQPAAANVVGKLLERCIRSNPQIATLGRRLAEETGNRLVDFVDWIETTADPELVKELIGAGFEIDGEGAGDVDVWRHDEGIFPAILLRDSSSAATTNGGGPLSFAVKVECVEDFAAKFGAGAKGELVGAAGGQFRTWTLASERGPAIVAVERHGWRGFTPPENSARQIAAAGKHRQALATRPRADVPESEGFAAARRLFEAAAADLGRDWACDLFFAAERAYWMSRNTAARIQYERQQKLGFGWANHDHHTYRNSREHFAELIGALELMGFECRERFYAGRDAGWGAQVLEQSVCGLVIFADVDMSAEELAGDFSHEGLTPPGKKLGTVGLWCRLHGEAFLSAGMHHLECQFDFDLVREQLAAAGIVTLTPFTDWEHLKQAFTKGEVWQVKVERIDAALAAGQITAEQATQFRKDGAIGSHLEILERNDGFKGFNQTGISEIITRTDPRNFASR